MMIDITFITEIPTLETEHYILKGMTIGDSSKLLTFMSHRETMKFITPNPVQSIEEMKEIISKYLTGFMEQKEIPWVIIHRQSGEVIGQFRLHKLNLWHKKAEMGAVINEDFQRNGVMTEIFQVILPFVFES
jgi:[ribosomal protein S5]-alanine N-acetyltransferase